MFLNFAKKNWDEETLLASYFFYIITNPQADHIWQDATPDYSRRYGAYWAVHPRIHFFKNLEGTRPNIQGRGGTANESAQ